jgi:hypothetical protein
MPTKKARGLLGLIFALVMGWIIALLALLFRQGTPGGRFGAPGSIWSAEV